MDALLSREVRFKGVANVCPQHLLKEYVASVVVVLPTEWSGASSSLTVL